jgi:transglutaminase-like putative cysteine protease
LASYQVEHLTRYVYASTVAASHHVAYLRPRQLPHQHVRAHRLEVEPAIAHGTQRTDFFGNVADHFQILTPHTELQVRAASLVDVDERSAVDASISPPWQQVKASFEQAGTAPAIAQFVYPSPYAPIDPDVREYASASFTPERTLLEAAVHFMQRINAEFTFDPSATSVANPVDRVLAEQRGVCQDFAHLQVSGLRSLGLAARYVSGYLLTDPPRGQPRLIGADASHAWLAVYCPYHGWVDLDPTNGVIVGQRHVTLAWGRDYGDVSPLRGVLTGGAEHTLEVGVSVIPVEEST